MKKYILISFLLLVILGHKGWGQNKPIFEYWRLDSIPGVSKEDISKGLIIGDLIPEDIWDLPLEIVNHPEGKKEMRLSDYKDKIIILDFWGRGCKPCIESVDKLNRLQPQYKKEILMLPVYVLSGSDSAAAPFAQGRGWDLPVVVGDGAKTLNQLFYHQPGGWGQVWIREHKVLAMPYNNALQIANLQQMVQGKPLEVMMVGSNVRTYFEIVEVSAGGVPKSKAADRYTNTIAGAYKDYNVGGSFYGLYHHEKGATLSHKNINIQSFLWEAYKRDFFAYSEAKKTPSSIRYPSLVRYRVSEDLRKRWFNGPKKTGIFQDDLLHRKWADSNLYCYLANYPSPISWENAYKKMQEELNEFLNDRFAVNAYMTEEEIIVWEIASKDTTLLSTAKGQPQLDTLHGAYKVRNQRSYELTRLLSALAPENTRVDNQISMSGNIDFDLPMVSTLDELNQALRAYGVTIHPNKHSVPVLVVEQRDWKYNAGEEIVEKRGHVTQFEIRPKEGSFSQVIDYTEID